MATAVLTPEPNFWQNSEPSPEFERIVEESVRYRGTWGLPQNDILFAATYWLMTECGFVAVAETSDETGEESESDDSSLPGTWKHGSRQLYEARFVLPPYTDYVVRLVALPAEDILCINVFAWSPATRIVNLKSLAVSSSGFVPRPDANQVLSKFSDLDRFLIQVRATVIWPVRCAILTDEGVVNGSLSGLSDEIKLKILSHLDVTDLVSLSETCHDLNRVCNDQGLWKTMFHRHFRSSCKCSGKSRDCEDSGAPWKDSFKQLYRLRARTTTRATSPNASLDSFHTAGETTYYDVDLSYE